MQEALPKMAQLGELAITWHYIGHVQANKTRAIAEAFQWVHTVDREKIAARLSEQRPYFAPPLNVLIQVNQAAEPQKGGVQEGDVASLARSIRSLAASHAARSHDDSTRGEHRPTSRARGLHGSRLCAIASRPKA